MSRELSDEAVRDLAETLIGYLRKPNNRGLGFVLDVRGLRRADREAVVEAVAALQEAAS